MNQNIEPIFKVNLSQDKSKTVYPLVYVIVNVNDEYNSLSV